MPPENYGATETNYTPDSLFAGEFPLVTEGVVIVAGQNQLVRGQVLGRITASGKYAVFDPEAVDGTEEPKAILANDVNAVADTKATAYFSGWFNALKLQGFTADTREALRGLGIYVKGDPVA